MLWGRGKSPASARNQTLVSSCHSLVTALSELCQLPHYQGTKWKYLLCSHQTDILKVRLFEKALKGYKISK
jgi:hypothetical protein